MKKAISILFSILILSCSFSNGFLFILFKIKQDVIAEFHCVNIDQPELACEGKCFFKDKMQKQNDQQNPLAPWSNVDENFNILSISYCSFNSSNILENRKIKHSFFIKPFIHQNPSSYLLRPPIDDSSFI